MTYSWSCCATSLFVLDFVNPFAVYSVIRSCLSLLKQWQRSFVVSFGNGSDEVSSITEASSIILLIHIKKRCTFP